jgi:hypothetical protein
MIDLPELTFEEKRHIYKLNGIEIPSVSKVMEPLSSNEYGAVDSTTMKMAAYRGTTVHQAIENYLLFGIEDIVPEYAGFFVAFRSWYSKKKPQEINAENRIYHKIMRYGGTVDLTCRIGDKLCCVDFKTSSQIIEKLARVQLEAYSRAFESHGIKFDAKIVVHLKKDGAVSVKELPLVDTEVWTVFGNLLNVHNFLNN